MADQSTEENIDKPLNAPAIVNGQPVQNDSPDISRKSKIRRTVVLYFGFIILGMSFSVLGPTLLDLKEVTGSSTEEIAFIITGKSVGILTGCIMSTFLMKYFDSWLVLGVCKFLLGVSLISAPWCTNVYLLIAVCFVLGAMTGQYDAGGNVCLLMIWKAEHGPWMQALHLVFGCGAFLAPLLCEPFLAEIYDPHASLDLHVDSLNETVSLLNQTVSDSYGAVVSNVTNSTGMEESRVAIPYGIIGLLEIMTGIALLVVFFYDGVHLWARKTNVEEEQTKHGESMLKKMKIIRIVLIVMIFIFYTLYCTIESEMGNFLLLFTVKALGWSKREGAMITSAFWAAFTISRGVGIFLVKCLKPETIIFADLIVSFFASLPLLFFLDYHPAVMWVCSILAGAGIATIFATGITWTENYIHVTESVGSVFMIGGAVSDMYGPILIVYLMEHVAYISYVYFLFSTICALIVLMICMQLMANMYKGWKESVVGVSEDGKEENEEIMNMDVRA